MISLTLCFCDLFTKRREKECEKKEAERKKRKEKERKKEDSVTNNFGGGAHVILTVNES